MTSANCFNKRTDATLRNTARSISNSNCSALRDITLIATIHVHKGPSLPNPQAVQGGTTAISSNRTEATDQLHGVRNTATWTARCRLALNSEEFYPFT